MTSLNAFALTLTCSLAMAATPPQTPPQTAQPHAHQPGHSHEEMLAAGTRAMGFDQMRTSHHFRLLPTGGVIEVHVYDPADRENQRKIAAHLEQISKAFAAGDFSSPFATHGEEPPGVATLKTRAASVRYTFEPTSLGGRVRIATDDREALAAVHAFLRYQIREHQTGDATEIERD